MANRIHFNDGLSRAACGEAGRSGLERDPARINCEACKRTPDWSRAWLKRLEGMRG